MGRIRAQTKIDGKSYWTLFDSGARNTYITKEAAKGLDLKDLPQPRTTLLAGRPHTINQICALAGEIEHHSVDMLAHVIDDIGVDESGKRIDILFGALAMQAWGIGLDVRNEKLDWTHYSKEFLEF